MIKKRRVFMAVIMAAMLLCCQMTAFAETTEQAVYDVEEVSQAQDENGLQEEPPEETGSEPDEQESGESSPADAAEPDHHNEPVTSGAALTVFDEVLSDENTVIDEAGLINWLWDHEDTGGTVTLGDNITITDESYINSISPPQGVSIIIETGEFGLTFDGGCIVGNRYRGGEISFRGEGVAHPVVDVIDMGWFHMGNWNNELQSQFITAYGKDGAGGTALRLSVDDGSEPMIEILDTEGHIRSEGAEAIGIELTVPVNIYGFNVSVSGENSIAVQGAPGATLTYCKLNADAGGQCVSDGITLDTCAASPAPSNAAVISRKLKSIHPSGLCFSVPVGGDWQNLTQLGWPQFILDDGSELYTDIDRTPLYGISTDTPSLTHVTVKLPPPLEGLGLYDEPIVATAEVFDPARPYFNLIQYWLDEYQGDSVELNLHKAFSVTESAYKFMRSDDLGESWRDSADDNDIEFNDYGNMRSVKSISFYYRETQTPVWFYLELDGAESNVIKLNFADGIPFGDNGGDRTGTDRDGIPGTEDEDDGDTTGSNPDDSGNGGDGSGNGDGTGDGNGTGGTPGGGQTGGGDKPGNGGDGSGTGDGNGTGGTPGGGQTGGEDKPGNGDGTGDGNGTGGTPGGGQTGGEDKPGTGGDGSGTSGGRIPDGNNDTGSVTQIEGDNQRDNVISSPDEPAVPSTIASIDTGANITASANQSAKSDSQIAYDDTQQKPVDEAITTFAQAPGEPKVNSIPHDNSPADVQPSRVPAYSAPKPSVNAPLLIISCLCAAFLVSSALVWVKIRKVRR